MEVNLISDKLRSQQHCNKTDFKKKTVTYLSEYLNSSDVSDCFFLLLFLR